MGMTPEGKIKKKLDTLLKKLGVWFYSPQAGPFGRAGIPDRVAILNGQFIGIECKADAKKKATRLQEKAMKEIEHAGGKCFLVYDDDTLENLRHYLVNGPDV